MCYIVLHRVTWEQGEGYVGASTEHRDVCSIAVGLTTRFAQKRFMARGLQFVLQFVNCN